MPVAEVLGVGEVRTHHTAADSTSLSSTLETADKLDIGLLLTGNDLSSPAFFSTGSACADLKRAGNFPLCSDKLASVVMAAAKTSAQCFSRETGGTSSGDVLRGVDASSFRTSSIVTGWKSDNSGPVCGRAANSRGLDCCSADAMLSRMRLTLSTKNELNLPTRSAHSESS